MSEYIRGKLNNNIQDTTWVDSLNKIGWERSLTDAASALEFANKAISISEKYDYNEGLGAGYKTLGALQSDESNREQALEFYHKAISYFKEINAQQRLSEVYLLIGNEEAAKNDYGKAIETFYKGIKAAQSCKSDLMEAVIFSRIADIKQYQGDFNGAKELYYKIINIQKKSAPINRLADIYYRLATFYAKQVTLDSALFYYSQAEDIYLQEKLFRQLATVYSSKGNVFFQQKNIKKAIDTYNKGFDLNKKIGNEKGLMYNYYQVGNALLKENELIKSEDYFEKCLELSKKLKSRDLKSKTLKKISQLYSKTNRPKKALTFYKDHILLRDSIYSQETEKQIAEIEEKYGNDLLQKENEQQAVTIKRNRTINYGIATILGFALLTIFLMYRNYQQKRKHNLLLAQQKETLHKKELETLKQTAALQSLNAIQDGQEIERKRIAEALHDSMGSLLSAIKMQLQTFGEAINKDAKNKNQLEKSMDLINKAAKTNRNIAHEMMPPVLMRFGLKAALDDLTDKLKRPDVVVNTMVYGMEKRYEDKLELALYRIIDELLNNILKHADASEINVQLTEHEDSLNIMVEDNGKGFIHDPTDSKYGLGLTNIQARVNHFSGELSIDSSPGNGTTVSIDVPIDNPKKNE